MKIWNSILVHRFRTGPKRLSGSAFNKAWIARDDSVKKVAPNMGKWLKQQVKWKKEKTTILQKKVLPMMKKIPKKNLLTLGDIPIDDNRKKVQEIIYNDPCKWPNVTDSVL